MNNAKKLKEMVENPFFTIEMLLQYLYRYHYDKEMIQLLVSRLYFFDKDKIRYYSDILIFYALSFDIKEIDKFFIDKITDDFFLYFKISNGYEIWGHQFMNVSKKKDRIRLFLEECETQYVNGSSRKNTVMFNTDTAQETIEEILIRNLFQKRIRNDFKDDVRNFIFFFVKLSYYLLTIDRSAVKSTASSFLHKLNIDFIKKRKEVECIE